MDKIVTIGRSSTTCFSTLRSRLVSGTKTSADSQSSILRPGVLRLPDTSGCRWPGPLLFAVLLWLVTLFSLHAQSGVELSFNPNANDIVRALDVRPDGR